MKVQLYWIGKTSEKYLRTGEEIYLKRLRHYLPIRLDVLPDIKRGGKLPTEERKRREGELLLSQINSQDHLVLLDESGTAYSSTDLAQWIEVRLHRPDRRLVLAVGGAFGFSEAVYTRSDSRLSLSKLTFSHQMVRLFLLEQLYRAMTIVRNEKYHNP